MVVDKLVLDPASGSRMMWFNKQDSRAIFGDIRAEEHILCDGRSLVIKPDLVMDFRAIPFPDESFYHVVFDPPHLEKAVSNSWLAKKYGVLFPSWREDLRAGFSECFRVLRPGGTLVFKWSEHQISVAEVLELAGETPLYGHRSGKREKTVWVIFVKQVEQNSESCRGNND